MISLLNQTLISAQGVIACSRSARQKEPGENNFIK